MTNFEGEFDFRHKAAAQALANGFPVREAAKTAGVSESSITRWQKQPRFQELIASEKMAIFESMDCRDREIYVANEELRVRKIRVASKLLKKIEESIETLSADDLNPRLIPAYVKAVVDLQNGTEHDLSVALKIAKHYGFELKNKD